MPHFGMELSLAFPVYIRCAAVVCWVLPLSLYPSDTLVFLGYENASLDMFLLRYVALVSVASVVASLQVVEDFSAQILYRMVSSREDISNDLAAGDRKKRLWKHHGFLCMALCIMDLSFVVSFVWCTLNLNSVPFGTDKLLSFWMFFYSLMGCFWLAVCIRMRSDHTHTPTTTYL